LLNLVENGSIPRMTRIIRESIKSTCKMDSSNQMKSGSRRIGTSIMKELL